MSANSSKYSLKKFLEDVEKWKGELEEKRIESELGNISSEEYEKAKLKYINDVKRNIKFINDFDTPDKKTAVSKIAKKIQSTRKISPEIINGYLNDEFALGDNGANETVEENVVENKDEKVNNADTNSFQAIHNENTQKVTQALNELNELNVIYGNFNIEDITKLSAQQLQEMKDALEDFQERYRNLKSALNSIKQKTRNHLKGIGDLDNTEEKKLDLELIDKIEKESILYMEPLKKINSQLIAIDDINNKEEKGESLSEDSKNQAKGETIQEPLELSDEEAYKQSLENEENFENLVVENDRGNESVFDEILRNAKDYADFQEEQEKEQFMGMSAQSSNLDFTKSQQINDTEPIQLSDEEAYKQNLENEENFEKLVEENDRTNEIGFDEVLKNAKDYSDFQEKQEKEQTMGMDAQKEILTEDEDEIEEPEETEEVEIPDEFDTQEMPENLEEYESEDLEEDYSDIVDERISRYLGDSNQKNKYELENKLEKMTGYISRNIERDEKKYREIRKVFKRIYYDDIDFNGDLFASRIFNEGMPQYLSGNLSYKDRERLNEGIEIYKQMSVDGEIPENEIETFDKFVLAPYELKNIIKEKNKKRENTMEDELRSQTVEEEELNSTKNVEFEEVDYTRKNDDYTI